MRILKETNKPVDLNEFLQCLMSFPVLSENPVENWLSFRMTMKRHYGRNKGRFCKKKIILSKIDGLQKRQAVLNITRSNFSFSP